MIFKENKLYIAHLLRFFIYLNVFVFFGWFLFSVLISFIITVSRIVFTSTVYTTFSEEFWNINSLLFRYWMIVIIVNFLISAFIAVVNKLKDQE